jgi:hypothetical protein
VRVSRRERDNACHIKSCLSHYIMERSCGLTKRVAGGKGVLI